jgi:hypothetical protein
LWPTRTMHSVRSKSSYAPGEPSAPKFSIRADG